jgi:hypothetical protein
MSAVCETTNALGSVIGLFCHSGIGKIVAGSSKIMEAVAQFSPLARDGKRGDRVDLLKVCVYDKQSGKINLQIFVKAGLAVMKIAKVCMPGVAVIKVCCTAGKCLLVGIGLTEVAINRKKLIRPESKLSDAAKLTFAIMLPVFTDCACAFLPPIAIVPVAAIVFFVRDLWTCRRLENTIQTSGYIKGLAFDEAASVLPAAAELQNRISPLAESFEFTCDALFSVSTICKCAGVDFSKKFASTVSREILFLRNSISESAIWLCNAVRC